MRYRKFDYRKFLFILTSSFVFSAIEANAIELDTITFSDNYVAGKFYLPPTATSRRQMVSNRRRGYIKTNVDSILWPTDATEEAKDAVRFCLQEAAETWEKYLDTDTISVSLKFDDSIDADVRTLVAYGGISNGTLYPLSLKRHLGLENSNSSADATIIIKDINSWQTGYDRSNYVKKNLTLAFMRSIALAMGFGSSVFRNEQGIITVKRAYSPTDKLISTLSGSRLSDIQTSYGRPNNSLSNYVQGGEGELYVMTDDSQHKLYAPAAFDDYASLKYLDESGSIMSYSLPDSIENVIDGITIELLNAIGWALLTPMNGTGIAIESDDIDSTGIASAYVQHTFHLTGDTNGLTSYHWTLELPLMSGGMSTTHSYGTTFTVPAITNDSNYKCTSDGCIEGKISFNGISGANSVNAEYHLMLELKPRILQPKLVNITPCDYDEDYYDADLYVSYYGSHYLFVTTEEELSTFQASYYSATPYYACIHLTDIDSWGDTWVTITARNAYGSKSISIVIPAVTPVLLGRQDIMALQGDITTRAIEGHMSDGSAIEEGQKIQHNNECCFNLTDGTAADWILSLTMRNGNEDTLATARASEFFTFKVTPSLGFGQRTANAMIVSDGNDMIFKGKVEGKTPDGEMLSREIQFLLLPSIPEITSVDARYDDFDWDTKMMVNAQAKLQIVSRRAKRIEVDVSDNVSGPLFFWSIPRDSIHADTIWTDCIIWDGGDRMKAQAYNEYGWTPYGTEVCLIDYVEDKAIKEALADVFGLDVNVIEDTQTSDYKIYSELGKINVGSIDKAEVYDCLGHIMPFFYDGRWLLPYNKLHGLFIIKITRNNKTITKKISL